MVTELLYTSGSWVCPARVFSVQVECWGPGGPTQGTLGNDPTGGGGGGAYAKKTVTVTPGVSYPYVIGDGYSVPDTHWVNASTVMAKGGSACDSSILGAAGGDASESVGDVKYSGGYGGDATQQESYIDTPGGGGGGAGSAGNGGSASDNVGGTGESEYGGNGGSATRLAQGQAGFPFGGGAAGCFYDYVVGGPGLIRITYDVVPINDLPFQVTSRGMFNGFFRTMR